MKFTREEYTEMLERIDAIERRVGLGKYAPVTKPTHGERVEARQKDNKWSGL